VRSVTKDTAYGIFPSITKKGSSSVNITINGRYNSSSSQTIDGTFSIEVYSIPFPNNDSPFA
jgi:hypothetical protein